MVVNWTTLPNDMLELISKSLESSLDLFQFRCVCSSWRNAAKPIKWLLPSRDFPILPDNGGGGSVFPDSAVAFRLSQRSILLMKPREQQAEDSIGGWLVKVKERSHNPRKFTLLHPLTDCSWGDMFFPRYTRVLDMSKFKVRELGREFQLHCVDTDGRSIYSPYTGKTLVKYLSSDDDAESSKFVLLTILEEKHGLAVYTSWNQAWNVINECYFCDVILFNGCFFAVDKDGRTVAVDLPSLKFTLAANPVVGGEKKFLIESSGEMLLVDMYLDIELDLEDLWNFDENDIEDHCHYIVNNDITHKIEVFKFVERDKTWVEVKDLGDQMLFLGDGSTFSASASDFLPLYGGSVYFYGIVFDWQELGTLDEKGLGVCDFSSKKIKLVRQHPKYAKLFWPPPF